MKLVLGNAAATHLFVEIRGGIPVKQATHAGAPQQHLVPDPAYVLPVLHALMVPAPIKARA